MFPWCCMFSRLYIIYIYILYIYILKRNKKTSLTSLSFIFCQDLLAKISKMVGNCFHLSGALKEMVIVGKRQPTFSLVHPWFK